METTEGKNDTIPVENGYHDSDSKRAQVYTNEGYIDGYSFEKPKDNEKAPATVSKSDVTVEEEPIKKVGILSVLSYARGVDYLLLSVAAIASVGLGIAMPLLLILFGDLIDEMIEPEKDGFGNQTDAFAQFEDKMTDVCLEITYVGCAVLVVGYIQIATVTIFGENILYRVRIDSFRAVLRQDIGWFDKQKTGKLVSNLAENMEVIRIGVSDKIAICIMHLATFVAGFVIAFMYSPEFAGVLCVLIPFLMVGGVGMAKLADGATSDEQEETGDAGAIAESTFSAIRTVVSFGGQTKAINSYNKSLSGAKFQSAKKTILMGAFLGFVFLVEFLGYGLAFWYGPRLIKSNELKPGEMITVFFAVIVGAMSLGQCITALLSVMAVGNAMTFITSIIERKPIIDSESDEGEKLSSISGQMEFRNLKFSYPTRKDVEVLKCFNLSVKPGQKIALVGASGSGKSTIVNLIQRFYHYPIGSITLDGVELKRLNVKWLRQQMGVVSQEPALFACSIRENILYGRENITQKEIEDALEKANAKQFVDKLPKGLDTMVGDRGSQLSGGQKQRIAIARALVRNPKILLLDEATSALDSSSEAVVQEALDKACAGRTTIIVAHRLSTVRDADLIVAMEHGEVIEMGTHNELLKKNGLYANLVKTQTLNESEAAGKGEDGAGDADAVDEGVDNRRNYNKQVSYNNGDVAVQIRDGSNQDEGKVDETKDKKKKKSTSESASGVKVEEEEPTPSFFDILKLNAPEWYLLLIACVFAVPAAGGIPVYGIFFGEIMEVLSLPNDEIQDEANFWALMFCLLGLVVGLGIFLESVFLGIAGARLTMRLRSKSFEHILRQDMSFFDKEENYVGQLTTRLAKDTAQIQGASGFRLKTIVESMAGLLTGLVVAFIFGWQLALIIIALVPIIGFAAGIQMKFANGFSVSNESQKGEAQVVTESISSIRTVQSLNLEKRLSTLFVESLTVTHKKNLCLAHVFGVAQCISQGMFYFVFAACFRFAAWLIKEGHMNSPDAFKVIFCLVFAAYGVGQSLSLVPDYDKAKRAALSVTKLLDIIPLIDNLSSLGKNMNDQINTIELQDVHFRYPTRSSVKILRGLNLTVKKGTTVALVGPSGCGKSTVMQLLQRFYDVEQGSLLIDGQEIKDLNIQALRRKMAIVSQEPTLFNDTIENNIRYGSLTEDGRYDPKLKYTDVERAAEKANILNFVNTLPLRMLTNVGDKGTQLSGGQKQRVAIARALMRDPEILLLDEATSALDSESEKIVQAALDEARVGRTCLVIAHRLTTIQAADEIVVIDQGTVVEKGTHDQLIAKGGMYKQFCDAQSLKAT
ncbi:ATP-dependent translocase ABCB1-like isoform X2 [Convolutriloba macropyga]|uniref:ATP-dependent translocase ABCB1-like isoform X2 n=1 Tax=Convolutriloba macropyga TaxID=536237 RepID=UPI003F52458B